VSIRGALPLRPTASTEAKRRRTTGALPRSERRERWQPSRHSTATHPNPTQGSTSVPFPDDVADDFGVETLKSANARLSPVCRRDSAPRLAIAREFELHGDDAQRFRVPISHDNER
jgi:hypothetical protein